MIFARIFKKGSAKILETLLNLSNRHAVFVPKLGKNTC